MPNVLDPIAVAITKGFKGKLYTGQLRRDVAGAGVDDHGDPLTSVPETYTFEGIVDDWSQAYKVRAGIPMNDVKVLIIAGLIKPTTDVKRDDKIQMTTGPDAGRWFQVRELTRDPARATFECQSFEIKAPS